MTLKSTIENIKTLAAQIPNMGFVGVGDIYKLNAQQNIQYPAFIVTQQEHVYDVQDDYTNINLVFFYVDRLLEDKTNELDIQSFGLTTIKELINDLNAIDINIIENYRLDCFTERFESDCAGALAYVTLHIPTEDCEWESIFDYLKEMFQKEIDGKLDKNTFNNYKDITDSRIDKLENQKFKTINGETVLGEGNIEIKGIEYDDTELRGLISGNTSEINTIKEDLMALDSAIEQLSREVENNVTEEEFNAYTANTNTLLQEKANKSDLLPITEDLSTLDDKLSTLSDKVSQIEEKGYLTKEIADGYYQEKGDYALKSDIPSLEGYAKKEDIPTIPTKVSVFENDKGYLTEHQDLSEYAKLSDIPKPYDDTAIREEINQIEITIGDIDKILSSI